jgi:hypothetical protein
MELLNRDYSGNWWTAMQNSMPQGSLYFSPYSMNSETHKICFINGTEAQRLQLWFVIVFSSAVQLKLCIITLKLTTISFFRFIKHNWPQIRSHVTAVNEIVTWTALRNKHKFEISCVNMSVKILFRFWHSVEQNWACKPVNMSEYKVDLLFPTGNNEGKVKLSL